MRYVVVSLCLAAAIAIGTIHGCRGGNTSSTPAQPESVGNTTEESSGTITIHAGDDLTQLLLQNLPELQDVIFVSAKGDTAGTTWGKIKVLYNVDNPPENPDDPHQGEEM